MSVAISSPATNSQGDDLVRWNEKTIEIGGQRHVEFYNNHDCLPFTFAINKIRVFYKTYSGFSPGCIKIITRKRMEKQLKMVEKEKVEGEEKVLWEVEGEVEKQWKALSFTYSYINNDSIPVGLVTTVLEILGIDIAQV
ncbi:MAG: hypothetical protein S4CHLAM27_12540 [Chlamydiia bacterium]|nr:hypothetical protein [Chlamydiia bacterium]